jgi:hypothetical protein
MLAFQVQQGVLDQAMILSGIILACWLASKKSKIIDFIAAILTLLIVVWILIVYHVIPV